MSTRAVRGDSAEADALAKLLPGENALAADVQSVGKCAFARGTWDHATDRDVRMIYYDSLVALSRVDTTPHASACATAVLAEIEPAHAAELAAIEAERIAEERADAERERVCPGIQTRRVAAALEGTGFCPRGTGVGGSRDRSRRPVSRTGRR